MTGRRASSPATCYSGSHHTLKPELSTLSCDGVRCADTLSTIPSRWTAEEVPLRPRHSGDDREDLCHARIRQAIFCPSHSLPARETPRV